MVTWIAGHWKGIVLALVLLAGGYGGAIVASWGLSHSETFCESCHYAEPYVDEWRRSEHSDVPCWKCHNHEGLAATVKQQTGNLVNGLRYMVGAYEYVPRAEVHDSSCLQSGCHENRKLEGTVEWKKGIKFDHAGHLGDKARGMKMTCVTCHSRIVQGSSHMTVTQDSCFLCHFKGMPKGVAVAGCKCHGTPEKRVNHQGFTVDHDQFTAMGMKCSDCHLDVTRQDGKVPENRCWTCHLRRDVKNYNRASIHDNHVTVHDIPCDRCHEPIRHEQVEMVRTLEVSCAGCHDRSHSPQLDMYMGVGARGVDPLPDVMFTAQVGCDGCHKEKRDRTMFPTSQACVDCHGKGYDSMLDGWKGLLTKTRALLAGKRKIVEEALAGASDGPAPAVKAMIERADANIAFLDAGHGEHNMLYAERVLASIQSDLDGALKALDPSMSTTDVLTFDAKAITADCTATCHRNIEKTLVVQYEGLSLSHRDHIQKHDLRCVHCHDNSRKHGEVRLQKQQCIHCHHVQQAAQCGEACHADQAAFRLGKGGFDVDETPDPMSGEVSCDECHQDIASGHDPEAVSQSCVECHDDDESYGRMPSAWQEATVGRVQSLRSRLDEIGSKGGRDRLKDLVKARGNLDLIESDRSKGAHNPGFAGKLLDATQKEISKP